MTDLKKIAGDANRVLGECIEPAEWSGAPADVGRYAALDAGKCLRTYITVKSAGLFGSGLYMQAVRAGACIEMVHNFSLIHDDMPCIDNDALRRGRPSAWAKHGERNAILGGDYLLNNAYRVLSRDDRIADAPTRMRLIQILSESTDGMILGEWMDCEAEAGKFRTAPEIDRIQSLKTGRMFLACTMSGAALGGADGTAAAALKKFTAPMGLCFQVTDDILDASGDQEKVGKTLCKDGPAGKATYVALLGLDGARKKADDLAAEAKDALSMFKDRAQGLIDLMDYMVARDR
ncbi:MAG: polyprenyl synthetase family protein [Rickettsiales bacterium]|nr:polyprenyl synthetase family protein [Rickettsiales bacterium]